MDNSVHGVSGYFTYNELAGFNVYMSIVLDRVKGSLGKSKLNCPDKILFDSMGEFINEYFVKGQDGDIDRMRTPFNVCTVDDACDVIMDKIVLKIVTGA